MTYKIVLSSSTSKERLYQPRKIEGFKTIGVITRDGYDTGALLQHEYTGLYVQANAGVIRFLDQKEINRIRQEGK